MKYDHQLSEPLIKKLKLYLEEQEHNEIRILSGSIKAQLRTVVAVDIKCHPRLLYIYGQFNKLKEILDRHLVRKEQLLFPFMQELVNDENAGQVSNAKVVDSFLSVFRSENDSLLSVMRSIDEASDNYETGIAYPVELKQSFTALRELSDKMDKMIESENSLFMGIHQSYKHSITNRKRA